MKNLVALWSALWYRLGMMSHRHHDDDRFERAILASERLELILLRQIRDLLRDIRAQLAGPVAVSATLTLIPNPNPQAPLTRGQGVSEMPATIHISGNGASSLFQEWTGQGGTGANVPPIGPVTYVSSDPTIATVDANGNVSAVAVGTATITATDGGNNLTASDTVVVTAAVAVSATLALTANP